MATARISLRHIEAFRAVMLAGTMTAAARRVHTSQPQISRLIAQLEAITQFPVFERKGSRLTPTQDGMRLFQEVEKTFSGLAGLESAIASIRSFSAGRLSVAAMPRLAGGLLARIVARFKQEHPDVIVSIHSGSATAVRDWLNSGFCDAGLALLYNDEPGIEIDPVLTMHCVGVLPRGHRLAALPRLTPRHFAKEPFISFPPGSPIRERIDQIFAQAGVERSITTEAGLGSSICALVGAGLGVSLLNPLAAHEEQANKLIELRPFSPPVPVVAALLFPPYRRRSRLVKTFSRYARELMLEEMASFRARERQTRRS